MAGSSVLPQMFIFYCTVPVAVLGQLKEGIWQLETTGLEILPSPATVYYPTPLSAVS
jgi:hypothetical protein